MVSSGIFGQIIKLTGRNIYNLPDSKVYVNYPSLENEIDFSFGSGEGEVYIPLPRLTVRDYSLIYYNTISYSVITGLKYIDIPFVSGFSPSSGNWGDLIRISGREFIEVTGVFVGDKLSENFYTSGENNLFFTIPDGSASNSIKIRATGGFSSFTGDLKVTVPDLSINGFTKNYVKYNEKVFVSGKGLHIVNQICFSGVGIGRLIVLEELAHLGSTGITFRVPTGVLTEARFRLNNVGFFSENGSQTPTGFNSVQTTENLFITGYSITNIIGDSGKYQDILPVSGTNMSGRPFYFQGYELSGGLERFVESLSYNYINNETVELQVPNEIIRGQVFISGEDGMVASEEYFNPIPTIFQLQSEYLTVGTKFTLKARNATEIYKLLGISGYNRYENKTGIYFILNDQTQRTTQDRNISDNYFGDFHVNYDALHNKYPSGLTTGHVVISGIINNSFVGSGFLFLARTNNTLGEFDLSDLDETLSFKDNFNDVYDSYNFGDSLFSGRVFVNSKTPVISGFTERVPRTGELEITGKYLMSSTGFTLGSGPEARFISSEDFVLDLADNVVTKVKTSNLQSNVYEYQQIIRIRTQDFGFTGKSGTLEVMYVSPS